MNLPASPALKLMELESQTRPASFSLELSCVLSDTSPDVSGQTPRTWRIAHSESSLGWGGQEHRVLAELAGFKNRASVVWLIASPDSQAAVRAKTAGLPLKAIRFSRWSFAFDAVRLASWLAWKRIEILNTHSSLDGWLLGIAGRLARVPLIIRSRHIDVDYPNRRLSRLAFTGLCDHIITTSNKISGHFQEYFRIPSERISTIPTGIDLERFAPNGPKATLPSHDTPLIGMISVLRSWKGHGTFLEAAEILRSRQVNAKFFIIGDGPGREALPQEIQRRGLGEIVTMLGHREDIPQVLRALNVLCIPSTKHEGVPQIGLQALATKTPVVGSDVGGIPEIIRPGDTGRIFPAGNAEALADAIIAALNDSEQTRRMCGEGRIFVEQNHSIDSMLDRIEKIYRIRLSP
jgi:glycosyltransferase involved in cell wall biosynthesis